MSERVVAVVDTWDGVDQDLYSHIELVENTNKNGVVSTRAYAIGGPSSTKRTFVKNSYKNDAEAVSQGQDALLAGYGHSPAEKEIYGLDKDQWSRNTTMLQKWEESGVANLRNNKHFWQVITDPEMKVPAEVLAYERFIAQDAKRVKGISLENGFEYKPASSEPQSFSAVALAGLAIAAQKLGQLRDNIQKSKNDEPQQAAETEKETAVPTQVEPKLISKDNVVYEDEEKPAETNIPGQSRYEKIVGAVGLTALSAKAHNASFNIIDRLAPKTDNTNKEGKRRRAIGKKTAVVGALALTAAGIYLYQRYWGGDPNDISESTQKKINSLSETNSYLTIQHQADQDTINSLKDQLAHSGGGGSMAGSRVSYFNESLGGHNRTGVQLPQGLHLGERGGHNVILDSHNNTVVGPLGDGIADRQGNLSKKARSILRAKGYVLEQGGLGNRFMTIVRGN